MFNNGNDQLISSILDQMRKSKVRDSKATSKIVQETIITIASQRAESMMNSLDRNLTKALRAKRLYRTRFEARLLERWQEPIDLLEILIEICLKAAARFNDQYWRTAAKNQDYVFDALKRLQARSCQISYEILSLLKAGLADGAHARWRTLYEIAVIAIFIQHQGQDVAKRYLQYEIVETYREVFEYQKHCHELGYERLTKHEVDVIERMYDKVLNTYGRDFRKQFGWIPLSVMKNRTFAGIEQSEGFDKLRPYYIMACHNVHSGPKGIRFRLGIFKGGPHKSVLLAGPSDYGLADPGQGAAISLSQITACLLSIKPTIERVSTMMVILKLVEQINSAFCGTQSQIEKEALHSQR